MKKRLSKILLVDDDEITNFFNQSLIEKMKVTYSVTCVNDGEEALNYLGYKSGLSKAKMPEIIFLDLNMYRMNGFEFLEVYMKIPQEIRDKSIIIVLSSSSARQDLDRLDAYRDVKEFLTKPLKEEEVLEIINRYFDTKSATIIASNHSLSVGLRSR